MKKLIFLLVFLLLVPTVFAQPETIVEKYSPILYFSQKENFFPVDVDYFLESSELKIIEAGKIRTVNHNPTIEEISNITEWNYFLDHKLNSSEIAADYNKKKDRLGYTVYYSVKRVETDKVGFGLLEDGEYTILQYWFFYAYSKSPVNQHEGDLEFIEIVLDKNLAPLFAAYSQHLLGESVEWNDLDRQEHRMKTDKVGFGLLTHPKVYVALGSHANYFKPYQGNLGLESDVVEDNGLVLKYENGWKQTTSVSTYRLVNLDDPSQKWIKFAGRWGDASKLTFDQKANNGVPGPGHGERAEPWESPVKWADKTLRVNWIWLTGNWIIENFYFLFGLLIIFSVGTRFFKIKKRGLDITPLKKLLKQKHAFGIFAVVIGTVVALVALVSPLYVVSLNVEKGEYATNGTVNIIKVDGIGGAQINTLQANKGEFPLFGLGLPITLLVVTGVVLGIVDIIFLTHPRKLAKKYIIGAIYPLLPLILIVLFISFLSGILPSFSSFASGQEVSPELSDVVNRLSKSPLYGQYSFLSPYFGSINLIWGVGIGTYLFLLAAALKIAGGVVFLRYKKK